MTINKLEITLAFSANSIKFGESIRKVVLREYFTTIQINVYSLSSLNCFIIEMKIIPMLIIIMLTSESILSDVMPPRVNCINDCWKIGENCKQKCHRNFQEFKCKSNCQTDIRKCQRSC
ncbi:unnamed protein product [Schistosoma mattheei]|uniref:Uncharacterized protein n=1 Tax=Schistosoma mattheei TaxID=31246 RepID=A0AA85AYB2_9TREM|nr:unnamed protein product [Schistosoma mattheei]